MRARNQIQGIVWGILCVALAGCSSGNGSSDSGAMKDGTDLAEQGIMPDAEAAGSDDNKLQEKDSGSDEAASLCALDPNIPFEVMGEILQFESADKTTCVWLQRKDLSQPGIIYKAIPFALVKFTVGRDQTVETIDDPTKLSWQSTHHNWFDVGEARTDSTLYRLNVGYGTMVRGSFLDYSATALDLKTQTILWGPVVLVPYPE